MSENTKIEWADHTLVQARDASVISVRQPMTSAAKSDPVVDVEPQRRVIGPFFPVMCLQIAAAIITTMDAHPVVTRHHVVTPALGLFTGTLTTSFNAFSINVARGISSSKRALPSDLTYLSLRFISVFLSQSVARTRFRSRTHFRAALCTHFFALHRGNERGSAFFPSQFQLFTLR